jgi:hypothetical protein
MTIKVIVENSFLAGLKKLPPDRQKALCNALEKFMSAPDLPGLRFRSLGGASGYFIINGAHGDRIILRRDADETYADVDAGPHDNVYRRWNR